jgi:hypothetical protein
MIYKTPHRKLKMEQFESHKKTSVCELWCPGRVIIVPTISTIMLMEVFVFQFAFLNVLVKNIEKKNCILNIFLQYMQMCQNH